MSSPVFEYSDEVAARFAGVSAAVITVSGFDNDTSPAELTAAYRAIQADVSTSLADTPPAERSSIKAWRSIFSAMGVKPTQHRNAAEALLRRLQRHGDVPSISSAVDVGNAVSIRHALPIAVFDLDTIAAPLRVVLADGDETFTGIGAADEETPAPDEVIFIDGNGQVAARRWCWKQGAAAATGPTTTNALYVIEAAHDEAPAATAVAADQLVELIERYFPNATITRSSTTT